MHDLLPKITTQANVTYTLCPHFTDYQNESTFMKATTQTKVYHASLLYEYPRFDLEPLYSKQYTVGGIHVTP